MLYVLINIAKLVIIELIAMINLITLNLCNFSIIEQKLVQK
jgi:hypothetical protein